MNMDLIRYANRLLRNTRPFLADDEICAVFCTGDLLEIGFLSKCCRNDLSGSCIMCDYGIAAHCSNTIDQYIYEMLKIINRFETGKKYLLICSNGSILDEYQVSTELLTAILQESQKCSIPHIIIETHFKDVTKQRLDLIKSIIQKPVDIEMGLETINTKYQKMLFMKGIDINRYTDTINLIKEYGFDVELNIMLGLPFLSVNEQIKDTQQSINWAISHNCTPIIFPINIKPHTMLRYIYDKKLYEPISLWEVICLLDNLDHIALSRILIAWYGNRDEPYPNDLPTLFPRTCCKCHDMLIRFFRDFLDVDDFSVRKNLINKLKNSTKCNCYQDTVEKISMSNDSFDREFKLFYDLLEMDYGNSQSARK